MRNIYLCAGHRGARTGAKSIYIDEGSEVINFRTLIGEYITENSSIKVIYDNDYDSLSNVVKKIKQDDKPGDMVIDLHFNAFNGKANGSEILIPKEYSDFEKDIADELLNVVCDTLDTKNRKVKKENSGQHKTLAMLSDQMYETVLLEICFLDNKSDAESYLEKKEQLAKRIGDILIKFAKYQ